MSYFGANIKKIRIAKKFSQTDFAGIFNISRASIGAYEEGRAEAKIDKIIEIAQYFYLTLDQLLIRKLTINEIYQYNENENENILKNKSLTFKNGITFIKFNLHDEYCKNINSPVFFANQLQIKIPNISNRNYRAFEYFSDNNYFFNNTILICEKIDVKKYVDKHKQKYFLILNNKFLLTYFDITNIKDILEVWKIKGIYVQNASDFENMYDRLDTLENKIDKILEFNNLTL